MKTKMNDFIQFESEKILDMECVMWLFLFFFFKRPKRITKKNGRNNTINVLKKTAHVV
jgi:hypothetical protein